MWPLWSSAHVSREALLACHTITGVHLKRTSLPGADWWHPELFVLLVAWWRTYSSQQHSDLQRLIKVKKNCLWCSDLNSEPHKNSHLCEQSSSLVFSVGFCQVLTVGAHCKYPSDCSIASSTSPPLEKAPNQSKPHQNPSKPKPGESYVLSSCTTFPYPCQSIVLGQEFVF